MHPKGADALENSVDANNIAPLGAVLSVSTLFAWTSLSKYLEKLQYDNINVSIPLV